MAEKSNLIIDCADFPSIEETGLIISDYCNKNRITYIIGGGYNGHSGFIGLTIIPYKTVCWECFLKDQQKNKDFTNVKVIKDTTNETRTIGPFGAIIGNFISWECLRYLTEIAPPLIINKTAEINFLNFTINYKTMSPSKDCPICKSFI